MKSFLSKWFYVIILFILGLLLIWQNYTPGTYLTGWDNLHPEFNFFENFKRLFFGVWRSEQGLGTIAGHSHMADLPRVILLWLWSFFLPVSFLRYAYVFFCLLLGPLGVYWLLRYLFSKSKTADLVAFLGAAAYLLNLSTLQQFFVVFEMFVTQWAFLPWLIFFSVKFLKEKTKSSLLLYAIFTLLATPQAYAAHLWYPFFSFYCFFLLFWVLFKKKTFKQAVILFLLTIFINSFWLLPNLFFIFNSGNVARENLHNQLYSQEFLAKNRATGTLNQAALMRGFYFDWEVYNFNRQTTENLMQVWNEHLKNTDVLFIGYSLFALSLLGLVLSFKKHNRKILVFSPFFVFSFILLANRAWPFSLFFDSLLRLPLFEEALRFSFSKISVLALFGMIIFMSVAINWLFLKINTNKGRIFFSLIFFTSLIIYVFPAFQGNFISPAVRQIVPQEYFDLWQYLQKRPDGRILTLPLNNPSGWAYYQWGYQGSGLIWFGMPQAVMDRDFDRWSHYNEQAYREFFNALYTQRYQFFEDALKKYRISYILRDLNQIPPGGKNEDQITLRRETNTFFRQLQLSGKIKHVAQFGNLILYELGHNYEPTEIEVITKDINPSYRWQLFDWQYQGVDYLTTGDYQNNYFSFRDIFKQQNKIDKEFVSKNIDLTKRGSVLSLLKPGDNRLLLQADQDVKGIAIELTDLEPATSYLIAVKSKYLYGFPLRVCLYNYYTQNCQINDQLSKNKTFDWDYFLVAGNEQNPQYLLQLNSLSYAGIVSASLVEQILVKPIFLDRLAMFSNQQSEFRKKVLILSQAFDPGWHAYLNGRELKHHVLVNNWANGWIVPEGECAKGGDCQVKIIFWPQYLEFIGFGLLILAFVWVIFLYKEEPVDK